MDKECIFCGKRPESKTSEHVLPQWLIEFTGDTNRIARFGYQHLENGEIVSRYFSFSAFQFPACSSCNNYYGELENNVKTIVNKIFAEESISEIEVNSLLDWFDKVRIGLWLGYRYLGKDELGVTPHFHIDKRISRHDRMLLIIRSNDDVKGLTCLGCDTPSFGYTPSCFSLRINNYCFLNMSYPDLISRRIGFPYYSENYAMEKDERIHAVVARGRERIMKPLLKKPFSIHGTELYQPVFRGHIEVTNADVINELYGTKYVRDNCLSWEKGLGNIFFVNNSVLSKYSKGPSKDWLPHIDYDIKYLLFNMQIVTLEWQLFVGGLLPSLRYVSVEKKKQLSNNRNLSKSYNKGMIKALQRKITDA